MDIGKRMRLFVDLDGTLAVFKPVDTLEILYEKNYFLNLQPQQNVVDAINYILEKHPEIEVNILSAVLSDSKYALEEKNAWLDRYLPGITSSHRIFPPCGESKKDFIQGGVSSSDFLLDDYTVNLNEWEPPAKGIKLMNGINGTKGTWKSEKISMERSGFDMAEKIVNVMKGEEHLLDRGPVKKDDLYIGENIQSDIKVIGEVLKEEAFEKFSDILFYAQSAILRQQSPWGAWFGRIVNNKYPQEYLAVDVEGIERTSEMRVTVAAVKDKKIFDVKSCDLCIDAKSEDSLNQARQEAYLKLKDFICGSLKEFRLDSDKGLTLYSPFTETTMEQHFIKLLELGYPEFPDNEDIKIENTEAQIVSIQPHIKRGR